MIQPRASLGFNSRRGMQPFLPCELCEVDGTSQYIHNAAFLQTTLNSGLPSKLLVLPCMVLFLPTEGFLQAPLRYPSNASRA